MSSDAAAAALNKRYEGLVSLRAKAAKGKGAWYWAHFDPILIRDPETDRPTSVKLRCTLCESAFSASNPSRTASEHLKRGTCPNSGLMTTKPIAQLPPLASPTSQRPGHRKRSSESQQGAGTSLDVDPINTVYSSRFGNETVFFPSQSPSPNPPVLSGGREDLRPLAQLEDSVKKLKSPIALPVPSLSQNQVDAAFDLLADWLYESCGSVTFSSLEHPKFKSFLNQVGLPEAFTREIACTRLDSKYAEARRESEARISEATFFQVSCDGWKSNSFANGNNDSNDECMIKFIVNLPNGTRVFQRAVCLNNRALPSQYAEEVMWETVGMICGDNNLTRCVGIVGDKFKSKALRNLETRNNWMINIYCQIQGFHSLIKDFIRELPFFRTVRENCLKIANLINHQPQVRSCIRRFRSHGLEISGFIRVFPSECEMSKNWGAFIAMLDDILMCAQILHLVVFDDSYKAVCLESLVAREVADIIQDVGFWKDLEGARSLVTLILSTCKEIEVERPLVGQCLPLWDEFRSKSRNCLAKHGLSEGPVEKIIQMRFEKNYHPAWSTAFILDPLNLVKDASGKYLPPFNCLTDEQERDVENLVIRLVPKEEAHVAVMELMKWRSEGLDPLYAQAVQVRQLDNLTGKMKVANPQSSRLVWETCLKKFKSLGKVAARLLFLHATSFSFKCDRAFARRMDPEKVEKMVFIAAGSKLERRDCWEKGEGISGVTCGEDENEE